MTLASMIAFDKAAWMCDLAETYGIYDYRSLPLSTVATFSAGLREDSRIKQKLRGENVPRDTLLLAMIYDNISRVLVALGAIENPQFIVDILLGNVTEEVTEHKTFMDAESYEEERQRILKGIKDGRN